MSHISEEREIASILCFVDILSPPDSEDIFFSSGYKPNKCFTFPQSLQRFCIYGVVCSEMHRCARYLPLEEMQGRSPVHRSDDIPAVHTPSLFASPSLLPCPVVCSALRVNPLPSFISLHFFQLLFGLSGISELETN